MPKSENQRVGDHDVLKAGDERALPPTSCPQFGR
jgi:hypothetical protein